MFEIPTHDQSNLFNCGDGDVASVIRIVGRNHAGDQICLRQGFRFRRQRQDLFGIGEGFGEEFLDFGRSTLNFSFGDNGNKKLIKSQVRLPEQFARGCFEFIVEAAADD